MRVKDGDTPKKLNLTDDAETDQLLSDDPCALMTGVFLDQQIETR